jgi:hypothetical protein
MVALIKRLPVPEKYVLGLDPEFLKLWDDHGAYTTRADERPVEEYRKNPASLSFTYPTWTGRLGIFMEGGKIETDQVSTGPEVFDVRDWQVPVSEPDGQITVRVYTPEGPGPFPVHVNTHGGNVVRP